MNAFLLTFHNAALEKRYLDHRVDSFFDGRRVAYPLVWFCVRTFILLKTVLSPDLHWRRMAPLLLFWLIPLLEIFVRTVPSRAWLRLHSLKLHFVESLVQGALAALMCTTAVKISPERNGSLASIIYSSGMLIQVFNMTWYCLPFKYYLLLNVWTTGLYIRHAIPSVCSGFSNFESHQALVGLLTVSIEGIARCHDGMCFGDCCFPCKKLYLWQLLTFNLYFCYLMWRSERISRKAFVEKPENELTTTTVPHVSCGGVCSDYLSMFLYILYTSWHIVSLFY